MRIDTQVGIIEAGPAGLLLSQFFALHSIDSVVIECRTQEYCETRVRAGVLEHGTVELLKEAGAAERLQRLGLEHSAVYLLLSLGRPGASGSLLGNLPPSSLECAAILMVDDFSLASASK